MERCATRILLIEDDTFMREALTLALGTDGFDVRALEHGLALEGVVKQDLPDLIILDLNLGLGPDGVVLTRRLRTEGEVPVIVISGSTHVDDRLAAFEAGADDFLVKPFSMSELRARVSALLRRANHQTKRFIEVGDIAIDESAHIAMRAGTQLQLRHIEFQVLAMFCRHAGQVLSKVQILEKVWGNAFSDVNLVEVHISHLRRELERYGPRVIHTVRSVGYVLQPDRYTHAMVRQNAPPRHVLDGVDLWIRDGEGRVSTC
jgi:two-component system OmpR family response regulator